MSVLICPICKEKLNESDNELFCRNNHHFDRAKQGYVNLLRLQSSSLAHHGDDRLMVSERRNFLEKGYYSILREQISNVICDICKSGDVVIDCGCGEGYYTNYFYSSLAENSVLVDITCVDISKEAAKLMAKYPFPHSTIVASAYDLPIKSGCVNTIIDIFAPLAQNEFLRVLKDGGYFIRVVPKPKHLYELKCAVYEKPYLNPDVEYNLDGFSFFKSQSVDYDIVIDNQEDISSLFKMTPYYYKTSREDQEKLKKLDYLKTQLSFEIIISRKDCI